MARKDSDNAARLEEMKPEWEHYRDMKIRTDAEIERSADDVNKAKETARKVAGSDVEDEIRQTIKESYEKNTKAVDAFEAALKEVREALAACDSEEGALEISGAR